MTDLLQSVAIIILAISNALNTRAIRDNGRVMYEHIRDVAYRNTSTKETRRDK